MISNITTNKTKQIKLNTKQAIIKINPKKKNQLLEFTLTADFSNANREFYAKYGDITAPIIYRSYDGLNYLSSGYKAWFRFYKKNNVECTPTEAFMKPLKLGEVLLPHEEAESQIHKAVDNYNKNSMDPLKIEKVENAHNGYTRYWRFMCPTRYQVQNGDDMKFGVNFQNGIGTLVSLGGDIYSYRLVCQNGAVVRDKKLGSFNIPHRISSSRMLEKLTDSLAETVQNFTKVLEYYKIFSKTKMTQQLLNQIVKGSKLPISYLPTNLVDIKTKKEDKTLTKPIIKLKVKDATLWDFFNGVTNPLTRSMEIASSTKKVKKISYNTFVDRTVKLHSTLIPLVQSRIR